MSKPLQTRLAKLYIEPTIQCNLSCRTCVRNVWDEPVTGKMSEVVFTSIVNGLRSMITPPKVFFGGFGEPLLHPHIVEMIVRVKQLNIPVELITNATLLTSKMSEELISAGLDVLWISLDGATAQSYADIRLGAALPEVLGNMANFSKVATRTSNDKTTNINPAGNSKTQLGIVFVAMRQNIDDLPEVINIGRKNGATRILVTNILPHTKDMVREVLFNHAQVNIDIRQSDYSSIEVENAFNIPFDQKLHNGNRMILTISKSETTHNSCPFIESGACAVSWDGNLSPCLPLLHNYKSYLSNLDSAVCGERFSRRWIIGNVEAYNLLDLWHKPEYVAFRERVALFRFPPCVDCGGCNLSDKNEEDCFGNIFPTCGGCLWAKRLVQCP